MALVVAASAAGRDLLVSSNVAAGGSVKALVGKTLQEKVTCRQACTFKTTVGIKSKVARKLGFKGVKAGQPWFTIATNSGRLARPGSTKIGFVLTPQARSLLPKAGGELQVLGQVFAVATKKPSLHVAVTWITTLS